ncbi:MAG: DUF4124 domain-containing protein [Halieaceae bacterium]
MLGPSALAEKGYYKWVDVRGNPHHSDRPPPAGVEYEFVSTDTGMHRRVSAEESRANAENGSMAPGMPPPSAAGPNAAEEQVKIEKDPALCDQAKANLDTLNSKARVRIRDPDGTIRYLTQEEKNVQRQKANDMITVHCNS